MFWMTVYFISVYILVSPLLLMALRMGQDRPNEPRDPEHSARTARLRAAAIATVLSLPFLPYMAVTLQTLFFLPSLRPALDRAMVSEWGPDARPRIVRVLRAGPSPLVYAVLPCTGMVEKGEVGALYRFQRTPSGWQWDGVPDAAWSECGSADGNTFPPYPEASEF